MSALVLALPFIGASIKLGGYGRYVVGIYRGEMKPNMATWTLWAVLSTLNSASYLLMSGDPLKASVALAGTTGCLITYVYALRKGSMQGLTGWDKAALGVGILAGGAWIVLKSASYANLILQGGFLISMIPTWRGLLADHDAEKPAPWFLMTASYVINIIVVATRFDGNWLNYVYPVLSAFTHGSVGIMALILMPRQPQPGHVHPPHAEPPIE
jgi:hypothetical protein